MDVLVSRVSCFLLTESLLIFPHPHHVSRYMSYRSDTGSQENSHKTTATVNEYIKDVKLKLFN